MSKTIGQEVRDALRRTAGGGETSVDVGGERYGVSVDVEDCERYAAGIRGVSVRPSTPLDDVGGAAERIADHVDAVDRLKVVEYDRPQQEAILRSADPEGDEEGVHYWEARVKPDETSVHRYYKSHEEPDRQLVAEPATHREIGELVDQIVEAMEDTES